VTLGTLYIFSETQNMLYSIYHRPNWYHFRVTCIVDNVLFILPYTTIIFSLVLIALINSDE